MSYWIAFLLLVLLVAGGFGLWQLFNQPLPEWLDDNDNDEEWFV